jgi:hypothetical protein
VDAGRLAAKDLFEDGLAHWETRKFGDAAEKFSEAVKQYDDGPSGVFLKLSHQFEAEAPPEDWDGVFVPKGK